MAHSSTAHIDVFNSVQPPSSSRQPTYATGAKARYLKRHFSSTHVLTAEIQRARSFSAGRRIAQDSAEHSTGTPPAPEWIPGYSFRLSIYSPARPHELQKSSLSLQTKAIFSMTRCTQSSHLLVSCHVPSTSVLASPVTPCRSPGPTLYIPPILKGETTMRQCHDYQTRSQVVSSYPADLVQECRSFGRPGWPVRCRSGR
jgi:hypothetical protein